MSIVTEIPKRCLYLLAGFVISIPLNFVLIFIWLIISHLLGYGDSGPDWVNTISDGIRIVSIIFSLLMSQLLFNHLKNKGTIKSK